MRRRHDRPYRRFESLDLRQIEQYTRTGSYDTPTDADRYNMIRTYFTMLANEQVPGAAGKMKQFAAWFTHGVAHGAQLRKAVYESHNEVEILVAVDRFFESLLSGQLTPVASTAQAQASVSHLELTPSVQ